MAEITKATNPSLASPLPPPNMQTTGLTAGEALAAWDAVYIKASDGKVYKATGAANNAAAEVNGFVPAAHAAGDKNVTIYHGDINVNYAAGLTPGAPLYLSGTVAGGLADAASTGGTRKVAVNIDATRIRIYSVQHR